MKKNYLAILMLTISTLVMGQTIEIVKDYYPNEKQFGLMPNDIVSNSSMMFFSGAEAMRDMGFRGTFYFYDAFISDGSTNNINALDVYQTATDELHQYLRFLENPEKSWLLQIKEDKYKYQNSLFPEI